MNKQDLFDRILMSLHRTVLDDSGWPATSGLIDEFFESKGNFLVFGEGDSHTDVDILFARLCFRGERHRKLEHEYFETYYPVDEHVPRVRKLPDSHIVPVDSLFTPIELKNSCAYNEMLRPNSMAGDSLNLRLDGPRGSRIVWAIGEPVGGKGWSHDQVTAIRRLLPHLRQFVRVRQTLTDAGMMSTSVAALLDNTRVGVIQLDRRGKVIEVNARVSALMRNKNQGLFMDDESRLCVESPEQNANLQRLLARALTDINGPGIGDSMLISHGGSRSNLVLHAYPMVEDSSDSRISRIGALALIINPAGRTSVDAERLESLLNLTPSESSLAASLARGETIKEIAAATGRSPTTIRWHLKQIFIKHKLSRQADLVDLVLSTADFRGSGY